MPRGLEKDQREVLLAVFGHFHTTDGNAYMAAKELKDNTRLHLSTSYISLIFGTFRDNDWIVDNGYEDDDPLLKFTMTPAGILEAESEVQNRGMSLDEFVADYRRTANTGRVVDTDHPYLLEADQILGDLEVHLREDNDVGQLTSDDREVARNEVAELRDAIQKPKIRTHYLWSKAHDVLVWIMEKGAGSIVGELAKKALKPIQDFITVFFN